MATDEPKYHTVIEVEEDTLSAVDYSGWEVLHEQTAEIAEQFAVLKDSRNSYNTGEDERGFIVGEVQREALRGGKAVNYSGVSLVHADEYDGNDDMADRAVAENLFDVWQSTDEGDTADVIAEAIDELGYDIETEHVLVEQ